MQNAAFGCGFISFSEKISLTVKAAVFHVNYALPKRQNIFPDHRLNVIQHNNLRTGLKMK
jgi:hypothetical protein